MKTISFYDFTIREKTLIAVEYPSSYYNKNFVHYLNSNGILGWLSRWTNKSEKVDFDFFIIANTSESKSLKIIRAWLKENNIKGKYIKGDRQILILS